MKLLNIVLLLFCVVSLSSATIDFSKIETESGQIELTLLNIPDSTGTTETGKALRFDSIQVINVDANDRIIGLILVPGFGGSSKTTWLSKTVNYTYAAGHRFDPSDGKFWSVVVYLRAECLCHDDNEIYYNVPARMMQPSEHHTSGSSKCNSGCNTFNLTPFLAADIKINFIADKDGKSNLVVDHKKYIKTADSQKKDMYGVNDWIANHGIYRIYDTRSFEKANKRAYGDESMHMIYYPPIQHIGSYFT